MPGFVLPKLTVPEARRWLPAVVLILCLSMFGMVAVAMFSVGADPESGPSSLPTSTAAQGYQGLKRLLLRQGHAVSSNRFEDGGEGAQALHADIEIITLNHDGLGAIRRMRSASSSSSSETSSASASSQAEEQPTEANVPEKRRADHILYKPLGKVVIVVAPKWVSGPARGKPRWGSDPQPYPEHVLRRMLMVLSPVASSPSPNADYDEDDENAQWVRTTAPAGKEVYDDGQTLLTYDVPVYTIRHSRLAGPITVQGAAGQTVFRTPLAVGTITDLQSITGPNLTPVLVGPNGEALISKVSVTQGRAQPIAPVYLVSDPDLLNNQILADPKKVIAALGIIQALAPAKARPSVVFNLTFNNLSVDRDLLHALSRPPYLGLSLSLILLGLGLTWAAFSRFGPPLPVAEGPALGRGVKVLADNAARIMAIAVKEAKLGPAYAQLVRDEVLKARGHGLSNLQQAPDDLADRIGRLYGASDTYTDLKAGADKLLTVHQLIDYARRLHAWKEQIGRSEIERAHK
ncbi:MULTISPECIES: hypothetical protein [Asticcacaulis]|uniref:hypothetical protein n=1 Tax=Asticcacaulis TaxID=76890 RepID=UPI001AE13E9C|nr:MULTISPECIES: hypothetical protein [Asticcacaulis]MBP2161081.1 hypothetical protein [Asticcacaulis solisilvae]MDR6802126.1 hypothetical protein [Asticcacaulis sp. BE141]